MWVLPSVKYKLEKETNRTMCESCLLTKFTYKFPILHKYMYIQQSSKKTLLVSVDESVGVSYEVEIWTKGTCLYYHKTLFQYNLHDVMYCKL